MIPLLEQLDAPSPHGLNDLGGAWDMAVLDGCRAFARLDEGAKRAIREAMNRDRSWAVVGWAEGMASLAVRQRDRQLLLYGLVGLSLFDRQDFDSRDAALVYPLFVRAAELLGEDADEVTDAAAELTDSIGRAWLLALLPAGEYRVPSTHEEHGSGATFSFRRSGESWDPMTELGDLVESDPPA